MDGGRFDSLVRSLDGSVPRRTIAKAVIAAALAGLPAWLEPRAAAAKCVKLGNRCDRREDRCCAGRCRRGRCRRCTADGHCPGCTQCVNGTCTPSSGKACGERSPGDTLRCCNGTCPQPTCRPAGTPCEPGESEDECGVACCAQRLACSATDCFCARNPAGGACASDFDCDQGKGLRCVCGTCCVAPGKMNLSGDPCEDVCCSGTCIEGQDVPTCA